MAITASHRSTGKSSIGAVCWMPALLTRISTLPNSLVAASTMREISAGFAMSAELKLVLTPNSLAICARVLAIAGASPKPFNMTSQPACASARAMPRPIPLVEPVTIATLPVSICADRPSRRTRLSVGHCPTNCVYDLLAVFKYSTSIFRSNLHPLRHAFLIGTQRIGHRAGTRYLGGQFRPKGGFRFHTLQPGMADLPIFFEKVWHRSPIPQHHKKTGFLRFQGTGLAKLIFDLRQESLARRRNGSPRLDSASVVNCRKPAVA